MPEKYARRFFSPSFPSSRGLFDSLGTERLSIQIEERPGKEGRKEERRAMAFFLRVDV